MARPRTPAPEEATPAKRMSLSAIVELLLHRGAGERSSVSLTRNAKGQTQIEVVVRTGDDGKVATASDALDEAVRLYDKARELYPAADAGNGGGA